MAKDIIKYIKNINRKPSVPRRLLEQFIAKGASTIPELSKGIGVSLPTTTNALNELMGQGLVREIGKKADSAGRIPMVYDLEPTAGYFVGVNPEMDCLALAVSDFCGNLITEKQKVPYVYENTPESLAEMGKIINVFIDNLPIKREEILEVCVNVAERVRPLEGRAYNMFTFLEESLAEKLTELLELPTCIENDSRSMTYGEFIKGCCKGKKDVIFVNVCWGLGIGIIIDGKLYYGKVVRILPIGAFVEIAPGHDGMVHISKLADKRIEKVEDACKIGDMMWVKVTEIDEKGRWNLSRKDALLEIEAQQAAAAKEQ